jgi:poly-gamma-glutamate synthesis protein (capsule biosynthesis protein)
MRVVQRIACTALFLFLTLIACAPAPDLPVQSSTGLLGEEATSASDQPPTRTPFQPLPPASVTPASSSAVPTRKAVEIAPTATRNSTLVSGEALWFPTNLPDAFKSRLAELGFAPAESPQGARLRLEIGDQQAVSRWVYALVAPFPTIPDEVDFSDLRAAWMGKSSGPFGGEPLLMDEGTLSVLSAWWGEPAARATEALPAGELLDDAWERRPAWAIVPFEDLEPRWKVLEVDGQSPLRKDFDLETYPLVVPYSLAGDPALVDTLAAGIPVSNRDPHKLTTVALTGVTALVRATAFTMRRNGITYPAQDIGPILRQADIAHISNEIPFTPDCPPANPTQEGLVFCTPPEYIELMEEVGSDIVELTGDHFGDWGPDAMRYTLEMYEERDWPYYGGGYDREDARQARLFEHNGNRLAFIGCNAKGGGYATAAQNQPGAVACDYDWMHQEIARLRQEGYQVIATFQHFEYYTYTAQPGQVKDFRGTAKAGAAVVSGSQAHQPQAMDFLDDSFIHYGLGNLFFDQYHYCTDNACDDGFINRHVFYDGRYFGVELIPIVFEDYARPRPMKPAEKATLLEKVFAASGW